MKEAAEPRHGEAAPRGRWYLAAAFLLLQVLLGGATSPLGVALALVVVGGLLLRWPPATTPGGLVDVGLLGVVVVAASGLVPVGDWARPSWWVELTSGLGVELPATHSAQPFLTAEALVLLLGGLGWLVLVCAWPLGHRLRKRLLWAVAIASAGLALGVVAGTLAGVGYPAGRGSQVFSYFPNRNQTAGLLAAGGVVAFALAAEGLLRRRRRRVFAGLACSAAVLAGLVCTLSRAGVLLFFGGCGFYLALVLWRWRVARAAVLLRVAVPLLLIGGSGFLFWGGPTRDRVVDFVAGEVPAGGEFRARIYLDTARMVADGPWLGVGLGNFSAVFPQYVDAASTHYHFVHPESDWFWLAAELGPAGLICALVALAGVLGGLRTAGGSGGPGDGHRYRRVAAAGVLVFLAHSAVDVGGHRYGTVFVAMLLFALARDPAAVRRRALPAWMGRGAGALLVAAGLFWGVGLLLGRDWPSARVMDLGPGEMDRRLREDPASARGRVELALRWAPLAWRPYFERARARLVAGDIEGAREDFRRARFLDTRNAELPLREGITWLPYDRAAALAGWREVLGRESAEGAGVFRRMVKEAQAFPDVLTGLWTLSSLDPELRAAILRGTGGEVFLHAFQQELAANPDLAGHPSTERVELLRRAVAQGAGAEVLAHLERRPGLSQLAWRARADALARAGDTGDACALVRSRVAEPPLVDYVRGRGEEELRRGFDRLPEDFVAGCAWLQFLLAGERWEEAFTTAERLSHLDPLPAYVRYWKAELASRHGTDPAAAWQAWVEFLDHHPELGEEPAQ